MNTFYDVAAYIWPAFTGSDPRARMFWPDGYGEWETVRKACKKFSDHNWPRKPMWGYVDEADPYIMEMEIQAAADHGVNVFIYDWYWYDRRPFLETCLNDGYLKARNNHLVKFYLMWANHDVTNLWDLRLSHRLDENIIWQAAVDRKEFEVVADRLINCYFTHPSYYRICDKPVFMIYDMQNLIDGLGGIKQTKDALTWFRKHSKSLGLPGLHLQACLRENTCNYSGIDSSIPLAQAEIVHELKFDSVSHYQFAHIADIDMDYQQVMQQVDEVWHTIERDYQIPYIPHVSVGWDNNPRFKEFRPGIIKNNSPDKFEQALQSAKQFLDSRNSNPQLITINSWNEWTEASYLQPDDYYGYGYLEAVRNTFKEQ